MDKWRLINTSSNNGFYNMAVDEAIVIACREGVVPPALRFYTWDPPCISIGYFQKIDRILNNVRQGKNNYEIIRRITGGRAVIHGNDLSYSVVSRKKNNIFPDNLKGTYNLITDAFICGLKQLGLQPDTNEIEPPQNPEYQHSTLCFDTSLRHESSFNGKKLIGSAQHRWPDIFLQHGSIILDEGPDGNGINFTSINKLTEINLKKRPDIKEVINAICAGFTEYLKINLIEDELTSHEKSIAEKLLKEKYYLSSWNNRRI